MDKGNIKLGVLAVIWCDRCSRLVNKREEPDHWHGEQCGGCSLFERLDADWGFCTNTQSVYCGRRMFEHDTCSQWIEGQWE